MASHSPAETENLPNPADAKFLAQEAALGITTVKLSELGIKKAETSKVKDFAEAIFNDQSKTNTAMSEFRKNDKLETPVEITPADSTILQDLKKLNGAGFDSAFVSAMTSNQQQYLEQSEAWAKGASHSNLKSQVQQSTATLKAHLATAGQLGTKPAPQGSKDASNTAVNQRDRTSSKLTPLDQGNSKSDIQITAQIRKAIIGTEKMSVNAQNVKVITLNGQVTLRGPVNNADEKREIGEIAARAVHAGKVDNQIDVNTAPSTN